MFETIIIIAFGWGAFSAFSLPLGSLLGLTWQPNQKINSAFMAYGAGALLFALTIELFGHVPHYVHDRGSWALIAVVGAAIAGGILFDSLNKILNNRGAFLRKLSSAKRYVRQLKLKRARQLLEELSEIKALENIPADKMAKLIRSVDEVQAEAGEKIFRQGEEAVEMYFIIDGSIDIIFHSPSGEEKKIARLETGETFGEMGILLDAPRTADALAVNNVRLYKLSKEAFERISEGVPQLKIELAEIANKRLDELSIKTPETVNKDWREETLAYLNLESLEVTMDDLKAENHHRGGSSAAMAIWLGILIDGIPESLIIGILAMSPKGMSLAFIAGVFLANLPEAMSSSVSMQQSGMSIKKIIFMWSSLCLMTGIGAAIGALIYPEDPTGGFFYFIIAIEGLAAGAMLTMIAETMLPEAFEQGGSIVGMATLLGFISALLVKVYA